MRHERPEAPEEDDRTCLDSGQSSEAETALETVAAQSVSSGRDARERVKLVKAALRFLEKGRVDRARVVLGDLLDLLGRG